MNINDASNAIITNNQSDLKFKKLNNKITKIIDVSELIPRNNQPKLKNNNDNTKKIDKNNNNLKIDSFRNKKAFINNEKNENINKNNNIDQKNLNTSISFVEKNFFFLKLNRFCSFKIKTLTLIILLIYSIFFSE